MEEEWMKRICFLIYGLTWTKLNQFSSLVISLSQKNDPNREKMMNCSCVVGCFQAEMPKYWNQFSKVPCVELVICCYNHGLFIFSTLIISLTNNRIPSTWKCTIFRSLQSMDNRESEYNRIPGRWRCSFSLRYLSSFSVLFLYSSDLLVWSMCVQCACVRVHVSRTEFRSILFFCIFVCFGISYCHSVNKPIFSDPILIWIYVSKKEEKNFSYDIRLHRNEMKPKSKMNEEKKW